MVSRFKPTFVIFPYCENLCYFKNSNLLNLVYIVPEMLVTLSFKLFLKNTSSLVLNFNSRYRSWALSPRNTGSVLPAEHLLANVQKCL